MGTLKFGGKLKCTCMNAEDRDLVMLGVHRWMRFWKNIGLEWWLHILSILLKMSLLMATKY